MGKRQTTVSPSLLSDMELYLLAKSDVVTLTKEELDGLPLETIQHFLGFIEGQRLREEATQRKADREARLHQFRRR